MIFTKNLYHSRLVSEKTSKDYQRSFQKLNLEISRANDYAEWAAIYQKLCFWELELDTLESNDLQEILDHQKSEANHQFSKFISSNYENLVRGDSPLIMSHQMIEQLVLDKIPKYG